MPCRSSAHLLVSRVRLRSAGVADGGGFHALNLREHVFDAPKTARRKSRFSHLGSPISRVTPKAYATLAFSHDLFIREATGEHRHLLTASNVLLDVLRPSIDSTGPNTPLRRTQTEDRAQPL